MRDYSHARGPEPVPVCTHGPSAVMRERCGAPAVSSFLGTDGRTYWECKFHHDSRHSQHARFMRMEQERMRYPGEREYW